MHRHSADECSVMKVTHAKSVRRSQAMLDPFGNPVIESTWKIQVLFAAVSELYTRLYYR
jgi:hypothetical protein